LTKNRTYM